MRRHSSQGCQNQHRGTPSLYHGISEPEITTPQSQCKPPGDTSWMPAPINVLKEAEEDDFRFQVEVNMGNVKMTPPYPPTGHANIDAKLLYKSLNDVGRFDSFKSCQPPPWNFPSPLPQHRGTLLRLLSLLLQKLGATHFFVRLSWQVCFWLALPVCCSGVQLKLVGLPSLGHCLSGT